MTSTKPVRTVRRLREHGVQFHSASERIDLDSPNGRLMFNVLASFDEYELDIRREYWAETKTRVMKERGVHLGRTPLGYLRASKQRKRSCDITILQASEILQRLGSEREPTSGTLVPDPVLAPAVRRAFELRAAGGSYAEIIAVLSAEAPRSDGRLWTHTQIARMLTLRVYLGEVRQNDLVIADAHEPIVDEALFAAAQVAPRRPAKRSPAADFYLAGLLRCAGCGFPMTGWNQPRTRASGTVDRVRVYRCVRQRAGGACQSRAVIMADAVENYVLNAFEPHTAGLSAAAPIDAAPKAPHDELAAELARVESRIRRLSRDLREDLDEDLWEELLREQAQRRRELLAALGDGVRPATSQLTRWLDLERREQFDVIRQVLGAVVVRKAVARGETVRDRCAIYMPHEVDGLLPSKDTGWELTVFDFATAEARRTSAPLAA